MPCSVLLLLASMLEGLCTWEPGLDSGWCFLAL